MISVDRDLEVTDAYFRCLKAAPAWFKSLFRLRNALVRPFGLRGGAPADIGTVKRKPHYAIGDRMGWFKLFHQGDQEIIVGADDKHLDFRLSLYKQELPQGVRFTATTIVSTHNRAGRIYLWLILPFHKLGMKSLLGELARQPKHPTREG